MLTGNGKASVTNIKIIKKKTTNDSNPQFLKNTTTLYIPVSYTHLDVYKRQ